MSTDQIRRAALALPTRSRAKLAEELLESIRIPDQKEIDTAWAKEIENRIGAYDSGRMKAISAEQVLEKLKSRKP